MVLLQLHIIFTIMINIFQIPDFDNLYLDMNGIFHNSLGKNSYETSVNISEQDIFQRIFDYIDVSIQAF